MRPNRTRSRLFCAFVVLAVAVANASPVAAKPVDLLLVNGKIITQDAASSVNEALAVEAGRITATGSSEELRKLAGPSTEIIDLGGRTVIPGLVDSHIHAIRAGFRYATEVNWEGATSLTEALERLRAAAAREKPDAWLIVAGGWTPRQFAENRRPTEAEIATATSGHPAYIQLFYGYALINAEGRDRLYLKSDGDLPEGAKFEHDREDKATGWIVGKGPAIVATILRRRITRRCSSCGGSTNCHCVWSTASSQPVREGSWRTFRPPRNSCRWGPATIGCASTASVSA
jgi:predicted amidohydrolase YtcJ